MTSRIVVAIFLSTLSFAASGRHALAAPCVLPSTLTNGQPADAAQVMGNFNAVTACIDASGPGAFAKLGEVVTTGSAATITFSGIPTTGYTHLRLLFSGKSTGAASVTVRLQMNGDAAGNYRIDRENRYGSSLTDGASYLEIGSASGTGASGYPSAISIDIPYYANTTFYRGVLGQNVMNDNGTPIEQRGFGWWKNTSAAVNKLTLSLSADAFADGSIASLYAYK